MTTFVCFSKSMKLLPKDLLPIIQKYDKIFWTVITTCTAHFTWWIYCKKFFTFCTFYYQVVFNSERILSASFSLYPIVVIMTYELSGILTLMKRIIFHHLVYKAQHMDNRLPLSCYYHYTSNTRSVLVVCRNKVLPKSPSL